MEGSIEQQPGIALEEAGGGGREAAVVVRRVEAVRLGQLPQVGGARCLPGLAPRAGQHRQQQRREHGDNREHHEQLDEGEGPPTRRINTETRRHGGGRE